MRWWELLAASVPGTTPRVQITLREKHGVPNIVELVDIEMIPVLQLAPYDFGADNRPIPSRPYDEMPDEWYRYWLGSLADSGVTGVRPVYRGSWNVPTTEITDLALRRSVLEVIFRKRRETELGMEASSVWWPLYGGLALYCKSENVVIEPGCCADLSGEARWHEVVDYKEAAWWPLPIGHPTQWVQYRAPRLIISSVQETTDPIARWAVCPERLRGALVPALAELERFAERMAGALPFNYEGEALLVGRKLAGLAE